MTKVSVPVMYDDAGQFLNGSLVAVNSNSVVIGTAQMPAKDSIPPYPGTPTNVLQIKDPDLGTLYLSMTAAEYQAAVGVATNNSGNIYIGTITTSGDDGSNVVLNVGRNFVMATVNPISQDAVGLIEGAINGGAFWVEKTGPQQVTLHYVNSYVPIGSNNLTYSYTLQLS